MNRNLFARANQIIRGCDAAYLGVIDEEGCPSVSTVSPINPGSILELYFATGTNASKTRRIMADSRAGVCFRSEGNNITLAGEAQILTDQPTKSQCWTDWFIGHFPGGETDPNYCVIKFTAKRASLWIDNQSAEFWIGDMLEIQSRCGLLCRWCGYRESHACGGCVETMGNPFHGECPVAKCCQDKGHSHCGQCPDMPCVQLEQYSCHDPDHGDNPPGARLEICKAWLEAGQRQPIK